MSMGAGNIVGRPATGRESMSAGVAQGELQRGVSIMSSFPPDAFRRVVGTQVGGSGVTFAASRGSWGGLIALRSYTHATGRVQRA